MQNSQDYLVRSTRMNHNAQVMAEYLHNCAQNPTSAVFKVHYPAINASGEHYRRFMRPKTPEFDPGYGFLFSIELEDMPTTIAFYDSLNVYNSVHLGAPFTLAIAYTKCAYGTKLDWAAQHGLKPTQIRITAGLEDTDMLLNNFRNAVEAADRAKNGKIIPSGAIGKLPG